MGERPIGDRPLLSYSAALLGVGTQFLCLGILGEMITAYHDLQGRHLQRRRAAGREGRAIGTGNRSGSMGEVGFPPLGRESVI